MIARALAILLRLSIVALTCAIVLRPMRAFAQSAPEVQLVADQDQVELGEPMSVSLNAMVDASSAQPSDPQLKTPPNLRVSGPFVSTQTRINIVNGHISQRAGIRATWRLVASAPGTYEIGPASIDLGGRRVTTASVTIVVVPPGSRPRGGMRGRGNPFDPFGQLFPFFGNDDDNRMDLPDTAPIDPQLSMDAPLDPQAFLRAIVDKPRAVVGEQVTLSIYLYTQVRTFQVLDPHEPPATDFFQRTIQTTEPDAKAVSIAGTRWTAQLLRKVALFPLRAGDLDVGSMTVTLTGPGLRGGGLRGGAVRSSRSVFVHVEEPPMAGRPPGYVVGDVGRYTLSATVEPRTVPAGGSIAVTALLRGIGNLPAKLRVPEQNGVSWLDPDIRESIDAPNGVVQGSRTFTFVVKLDATGKIDLGELTLPYFNPQSRTYELARAPLGSVTVTGAAAPVASSDAPRDPFAAVAAPRSSATIDPPPKTPFTDLPWFWLAIGGCPAAVVIAEGGTRAWRKARAARLERANQATTRAREAIAEARDAERKRDGKRAASAVERAIVIAADGATGLKLRGLLRDEVARALEKEGIAKDDAAEIEAILRACDAWRFEPGASPPNDPIGRAEAIAKKLARWKRPS